MKKLAKILTVVLTVCLLCGVVMATVVSAENAEGITTQKSDTDGSLFAPVGSGNGVSKSSKTYSTNTYTKICYDVEAEGFAANNVKNYQFETKFFNFAD